MQNVLLLGKGSTSQLNINSRTKQRMNQDLFLMLLLVNLTSTF